jgi:multiple sugar transport system permease protein
MKPKKAYHTHAWMFLAPAVIVLLGVGIYPLLFAVWNSLHRFVLSRPRDKPFVFLQNYLQLMSDESFLQSLGRTFLFLIINLPMQLALGLLIALLLHKSGNETLKKITRVALVVPLAMTFAVVGLMGRLMFNGSFGVLTYFWRSISGLVESIPVLGGLLSPLFFKGDFLADPTFAFVSVSLMDIWQWTPFCALVLFSSLTMVPQEIEEAAKLETEHWWHILWKVQLPFLLPGITAILILRTADILKMFDVVFTMTKGGPGAATELISVYVQRIGFRAFDQGLASAQAVILLVITIILSRTYIRLVYREI